MKRPQKSTHIITNRTYRYLNRTINKDMHNSITTLKVVKNLKNDLKNTTDWAAYYKNYNNYIMYKYNELVIKYNNLFKSDDKTEDDSVDDDVEDGVDDDGDAIDEVAYDEAVCNEKNDVTRYSCAKTLDKTFQEVKDECSNLVI